MHVLITQHKFPNVSFMISFSQAKYRWKPKLLNDKLMWLLMVKCKSVQSQQMPNFICDNFPVFPIFLFGFFVCAINWQWLVWFVHRACESINSNFSIYPEHKMFNQYQQLQTRILQPLPTTLQIKWVLYWSVSDAVIYNYTNAKTVTPEAADT